MSERVLDEFDLTLNGQEDILVEIVQDGDWPPRGCVTFVAFVGDEPVLDLGAEDALKVCELFGRIAFALTGETPGYLEAFMDGAAAARANTAQLRRGGEG